MYGGSPGSCGGSRSPSWSVRPWSSRSGDGTRGSSHRSTRKTERERDREVLARELSVRGHVPEFALRAFVQDGQVDVADQPALVGDHQVPARAQHPRELAEGPPDVREVDERDRADNEVDGVVLERKRVEVGLVELSLRDLLAGDGEHAR